MFYVEADAGPEDFFFFYLLCFGLVWFFPSLSCSFLAHPQNLHFQLHKGVLFQNTKAQNQSLLILTVLGQLSVEQGKMKTRHSAGDVPDAGEVAHGIQWKV